MSLRVKTILGIVLIQASLMIVLVWSALQLMQQSHETELRQRATTAARLFATTTKDGVLSMDLASLKSFVKDVLANPDFAYARVKSVDCRILAEAGPPAILNRPFAADLDFQGIDDGVFDIFAPIQEAGLTFGRVEIGISIQSIRRALTQARQRAVIIAGVEIVLSILLSGFLGAYLVRRLNLLTHASERIGAGDLGYQINAAGNDEIGVTAQTFNRMSRHLKQSLSEIQAKNASLEAEIARRREAEARLQAAQEELEIRVAERTEELGSTNEHLKTLIEERRIAAAKQKELEAQLQRTQKMEALGTLAGGVAHDLNNVLSGIVSYPDLLLLQIEEESPLRKPIETIRNSGQKAAAIVQDLLTLARRGVTAKGILNLNDIIDEYLESPEYDKLRARHPGVRLRSDLDPDLLNIEGSPVHLAKTVMNLVTNAAEAMPEAGEIRIRTRNRYVDQPIEGYDAIVEGDYVVFSVSDQGVGIGPRDRERIFEPFYTKKHMGRSGTGLGMAVVWGSVKDHHGYIDLQSTPGQGSVFTLYFPCTRRRLEAAAPSAVSPATYGGRGETVLVVDDVEEQRDIADSVLTKLGYRVDTVPGGEAAVRYLTEKDADLVLLDMIMEPGMDGLDTYRAILSVKPGQKAVIASGYSETDRVKEAQRLGAREYVQKPYTLENIGLAVRKTLDETVMK